MVCKVLYGRLERLQILISENRYGGSKVRVVIMLSILLVECLHVLHTLISVIQGPIISLRFRQGFYTGPQSHCFPLCGGWHLSEAIALVPFDLV